jgi:hypothetical protein
MRLSEPKIRYVSEKMTAWLAGRDDVQLRKSNEALAQELATVIRDELRLEDELDGEVEKVLGLYKRQIESENMDLDVLRRRIKKQLAKEKGIVL